MLTVVSMIQALALELLWSRVGEEAPRWTPGWEALLGWSQIAACLLGALLIWLLYLSMVIRFSWLPTIRDSTVPFAIGLLEFSLIDRIGSDSLGTWFGVLALLFSISIWISHVTFRRARQDPANQEFFASLEPAGIRDFAAPLLSVLTLFVLAAIFSIVEDRGGFALASILLAIALIGLQLWGIRGWWQRALGDAPSPESSTESASEDTP